MELTFIGLLDEINPEIEGIKDDEYNIAINGPDPEENFLPSKEEVKQAIKKLKNNKSPGT
jgi:hypothetical protein